MGAYRAGKVIRISGRVDGCVWELRGPGCCQKVDPARCRLGFGLRVWDAFGGLTVRSFSSSASGVMGGCSMKDSAALATFLSSLMLAIVAEACRWS